MASVVELKDVLPPCPPEGIPFYVLYETICNNIRAAGTTKDIMTEFQELKTDLARVSFVYQFPELLDMPLDEHYSTKNSEDASSFESVCNMLMPNETSADKAHEMINKSIQKTPLDEKTNLAIRYMKRAWSNLLLEDFENAFIDAKRSQSFDDVPNKTIWNSYEILGYCYARKMDYKNSEKNFLIALENLRSSGVSNELKATVTGRIMTVFKTVKTSKPKKSKDKLDTTSNTQSIPKVSYGVHKYMEQVSSALDVVTVQGKGRCVIANRLIKPGDILIVDHPFSQVLLEDHLSTHCLHCFTKCTAPIPCQNCAKVWFCNEKCRDASWSSCHRWECRVANHLNDHALGKMAIIVFRIMTTISWEKLKKNRTVIEDKIQFEKENEESTSVDSILEGVTRKPWDWEGTYSCKDYNPVFHLVTNDSKRAFGDLFKRALASIFVVKCLEIVNYFDGESNDDDRLFAASLVLRHMQSSSCNAYEISEFELKNDNQEIPESRELGGAIYSSISLTNHSCFPNTARHNVGTAGILRATRTIQAGDEVYDNYGYLFNTCPQQERMAGLQNQYKFICECNPCSNNWDVYPHKSDGSLYFKCPGPNCGKPVAYSDLNFVECPECGNVQQFIKLQKELMRQMDMYNEAMTRIQTSDHAIALNQLIGHQIFLDKHAALPCSHYTDTQEALGYCFNLRGNIITPTTNPSSMAEADNEHKTINLKKKEKKKYVSHK